MTGKELQSAIEEALGPYPLTPAVIEAIRFLFMNRFESMAIVNRRGEIEFLDKMSEKVFNLSPGESCGRLVTDTIPNTRLLEVVNSGVPHIGKTLEVRGNQRIISRYPLIKDGKIVGAFGRVLIYSLEALERALGEANRLRIRVMNAERKAFSEHRAVYTFNNILGVSKKIREIVALASRIAETETDVLIEGESGTGKELFAHAIHNHSKFSAKPFVKVNCPAIPNELAEAELFGYEKGAFTGALKEGRAGKFELAHGGTIFLDEICSLPLSIQAKLLRVLQEREIERIGSQRLLHLNFRLITATNSNLTQLSEQGDFRSDLYYRISQSIIQIPPLRERPEDIPVYVRHFLGLLKKRLDHSIDKVSQETLDRLVRYAWPGNVRELMGILERSILQAVNERELKLNHLPEAIRNGGDPTRRALSDQRLLCDILAEAEKTAIVSTLQQMNGNKRKTAQRLGIQRSALYKKIKSHGIVV